MRQSTRTLVTMVALLAVAGAVGLYAWKGVYGEDQAREARTERSLRAFPAAEGADAGELAADLDRLTVTSGAERAVLERQPDGRWRLTAPFPARADQAVVEGMLRELRTARFKAALEERPDPATLERYGLDHPRFTVEARPAGGAGKALVLEGGIDNPFDGSVFVRRGGEAAVYAAAGSLRLALVRSPFELRDKQLLALEEPALERLEVRGGAGGGFTLARDERGAWALVAPLAGPADPAGVAALVSQASGERAVAFPADAGSLERLFARPAVAATASLRDGGVVELALAHPPGDGGVRWYARRQDAEGTLVAEVNAWAASAFERPAAALKARPPPDAGVDAGP